MKTKLVILTFLILSAIVSRAQIGGESTYEFLNLPNSARMAALGGNQVAVNDSNDLNVAYNNPALLHTSMDNKLLINYVSYFDDIKFGYASYAKDYGKLGVFALGMHYINYGKFTYTDVTGERAGTFNAAEYALNIMWSRTYKRFRYGATLKPILWLVIISIVVNVALLPIFEMGHVPSVSKILIEYQKECLPGLLHRSKWIFVFPYF